MKKTIRIGFLVILAAAVMFLLACRGKGPEPVYEAQRALMGTIVKIKGTGKDLSRERFDTVSGQAFDEIARLEREMSEWLPDSPISLAARFAGRKAVPVSEEIVTVVDLALSVSRRTEGAFDISFKPLGRLWKVESRKEPPPEDQIRAARALVDYRNIVLDKERRPRDLKLPGMASGRGAIAKGYAAGRAVQAMCHGGIPDAIVDAGGDLYFSGKKGAEGWTCGIQDPIGRGGWSYAPCSEGLRRRDERGLRAVLRIQGKAVPPLSIRGPLSSRGRPECYGYGRRPPTVADAYASAFSVLGPERASGSWRRSRTWPSS
jgi:thiamine biosynthesis lipoprotein